MRTNKHNHKNKNRNKMRAIRPAPPRPPPPASGGRFASGSTRTTMLDTVSNVGNDRKDDVDSNTNGGGGSVGRGNEANGVMELVTSPSRSVDMTRRRRRRGKDPRETNRGRPTVPTPTQVNGEEIRFVGGDGVTANDRGHEESDEVVGFATATATVATNSTNSTTSASTTSNSRNSRTSPISDHRHPVLSRRSSRSHPNTGSRQVVHGHGARRGGRPRGRVRSGVQGAGFTTQGGLGARVGTVGAATGAGAGAGDVVRAAAAKIQPLTFQKVPVVKRDESVDSTLSTLSRTASRVDVRDGAGGGGGGSSFSAGRRRRSIVATRTDVMQRKEALLMVRAMHAEQMRTFDGQVEDDDDDDDEMEEDSDASSSPPIPVEMTSEERAMRDALDAEMRAVVEEIRLAEEMGSVVGSSPGELEALAQEHDHEMEDLRTRFDIVLPPTLVNTPILSSRPCPPALTLSQPSAPPHHAYHLFTEVEIDEDDAESLHDAVTPQAPQSPTTPCRMTTNLDRVDDGVDSMDCPHAEAATTTSSHLGPDKHQTEPRRSASCSAIVLSPSILGAIPEEPDTSGSSNDTAASTPPDSITGTLAVVQGHTPATSLALDDSSNHGSNAEATSSSFMQALLSLPQKIKLVGRRSSTGVLSDEQQQQPHPPELKRQQSAPGVLTSDEEVLPEGAVGWIQEKRFWKPDSHSTICDDMYCKSAFTTFNRRHHCRMCGGVYCDEHTSYTLQLAVHDSVSAQANVSRVRPERACRMCWNEVFNPRRAASEDDDEDDQAHVHPSPLIFAGRRVPRSLNGERTSSRSLSAEKPSALSSSTISRNRNRLTRYATAPSIITVSGNENRSPNALFVSTATKKLPMVTVVPDALVDYPLATCRSSASLSSAPSPKTGHNPVQGPSSGSQVSLMDLTSASSATTNASTFGFGRSQSRLDQSWPSRFPEHDFVPEQWGYDRDVYDTEMESDDEDDMAEGDGDGDEYLNMRARKHLIRDGDIVYKAPAPPRRKVAASTRPVEATF